jgi:hypothetical protein
MMFRTMNNHEPQPGERNAKGFPESERNTRVFPGCECNAKGFPGSAGIFARVACSKYFKRAHGVSRAEMPALPGKAFA